MSLRRSSPTTLSVLTTQELEKTASSRLKATSPKTAARRRNTVLSLAAVLLLVGAYSTTLSSQSSSSHKSSGFLRSSTPEITHKLPNFEPIHEECKLFGVVLGSCLFFLTHRLRHTGTVWIAPSYLKGFAGYGVFTTRDLEKGEHIIGRPDGVAVPVEFDWPR